MMDNLEFNEIFQGNTYEVKALPFSHDLISQVVDAKANGEDSCLNILGSMNYDWEEVLNYLSYSYIKFNILESEIDIVDKDLWFNQNNLIWNYFQSNKSRLKEVLSAYFCPNIKNLSYTQCDLEEYSLAELSILEFGDFVFDYIKEQKIEIDVKLQADLLQTSAKRRKIFEILSTRGNNRGRILQLLPSLKDDKGLQFKYRDTLKKNIHSSSLPLGFSDRNTVNLHLEVLDNCDQKCPGCFVKRKNKLPTDWNLKIDELFSEANFNEWNEVVVGPTDIFSATNFDEVFNQRDWSSEILSKFTAITFNSTLNMPDEEIIRKFKRIREIFLDKQLEFFIIVDIDKFLSEDPAYLSWLDRKLSLLENSNIILTINTPEIFYWRFEAPGEIAYRHFGKNFKYTLSFFRSSNKQIISKYLKSITDKSYSHTNILNYTYDRYFGGMTYTTYVYKGGDLYWAPCVIDFVFIEDERFKIKHYDMVNDLRSERESGDCITCPEVESCRAKGVLGVKNFLGTDSCILPQDFSAKHLSQ